MESGDGGSFPRLDQRWSGCETGTTSEFIKRGNQKRSKRVLQDGKAAVRQELPLQLQSAHKLGGVALYKSVQRAAQAGRFGMWCDGRPTMVRFGLI